MAILAISLVSGGCAKPTGEEIFIDEMVRRHGWTEDEAKCSLFYQYRRMGVFKGSPWDDLEEEDRLVHERVARHAAELLKACSNVRSK